MRFFAQLAVAAIYATFVQNLVFSSGYGLSEAIRIARRPKYLMMYGITVTLSATLTSVLCGLLDRISAVNNLSNRWHIAVFAVVLAVLYLIASVILLKVFRVSRKFMNSLGICALNTLVLAVLLVNHLAGYGIGAGGVFVIAVFLINSGMRRLVNNDAIPGVFRGMPAMFAYTALLSLAFLSFSGEAFIV
ncbi:MAG: hypothetical protein MJ177_03520 [Clostridia bacterium]|nr:hypothetical protein [Clostridia bacterium]